MHARRVLAALSLLAGAGAGCHPREAATARADGGAVARSLVASGPSAGPLPGASSAPPSALAPPRPGELPADPAAVLDDLLAGDLRVVGLREVNATVWRLDLERGGRRFRAKWKPLGPGASEVQEGFDGNNAPRCEVAAWRVNRLLFGAETTERHLVAPVVVRAFHRDLPCSRACAHVPRLPPLASPPSGDAPATFPEENDHLVLGALTYWIEGVSSPERFHGGLWDHRRFDEQPGYRRSFSDLCLFLYLIAHGDANYDANFLARLPALDRLYSIDNGRAFDGVSFYTAEGDPDWRPFATLGPEHLVAPAFARTTVARLGMLDQPSLGRELRIAAAVDLASGAVAREPSSHPVLGALAARPLAGQRGVRRIGRGAFLARAGERTWLLLGIGERGIAGVAERARRLVRRLGRPGAPLFDE